MARRITTNFQIIDADTQREIAGSKTPRTRSLTGSKHTQTRLDLTTGETTFTFPSSIGDAGQVVIENLDATNTVEFGTATGVRPMRVGPGRYAVVEVPVATTALFLAAVAGTPSVEVSVLES